MGDDDASGRGSRRRRRRGASGWSTSAGSRRRRAARRRCRSGRCGRARARRAPRSPRRAGRPPGRSGENAWMLGWNLKPRTPCSSTSRRASAHAGPALRTGRRWRTGSARRRCARAPSATSSLEIRGVPGRVLGVDGEDHRGHLALAVVRGQLVDASGGPPPSTPEVRRRRRRSRSGLASRARTVGLGVRVHVDRDERLDVDRGRLRSGTCSGLLRAASSGTWAPGCRRSPAPRRPVDSNASAIASAVQPPSAKALRHLGRVRPQRRAGRRRCRWPGR